MIVASADKAKELTDKPVWIKGMGNSVETYYIGERDRRPPGPPGWPHERAYKLAGITDAPDR